MTKPAFTVGDRVEKFKSDYVFIGEVRAIFTKRSGHIRVVVENDDGILHILNLEQIIHTDRSPK